MAEMPSGPHLWVTERITDWDLYQHGISRVIASQKTAFQQMHIVESGSYGKALVLDGLWQSSLKDEFIYHEALVHPPMIFQGAPERVLVLGGGEGATSREVLRWQSVKHLTQVDIDGQVIEACREHLLEMHQGSFDDPRLSLNITDAFDFVAGAKEESWEVIISDLTDPLEQGPSFKLFTREFFAELKRVLAPGGYISLQAAPVSPLEVGLHARMINTLRQVFPQVRSYTAHIPTYGRPYGFALASGKNIPARPQPEKIDEIMGKMISGRLRFLDGQCLLGILQTPLYLRRAVEKEDFVYSLESPPRFTDTLL